MPACTTFAAPPPGLRARYRSPPKCCWSGHPAICSASRRTRAWVGTRRSSEAKKFCSFRRTAEYEEVRRKVTQEKCSLVEAERSVFQIDHAEVGAWMAERWQLPPERIAAIGQHQNPEKPTGPDAVLIAATYASNVIVAAADQLAKNPNVLVSIELPEAVGSTLGISQVGLVQLATELHAKRKQIESLLL